MSDLLQQIAAARQYIQGFSAIRPLAGIILGSGLGDLAKVVEAEVEIPYADIPNFPHSTVEGHAGKLIFGTLKGRQVVLMAGGFHYYEGYTMQEVTFPVRVMKALGVETLVVSNAAGGMNPAFKVGDIMFIRDHINQFPEHPLRGKNDDRLGTRFPDMSEPYNLGLLAKAKDIARKLEIPVHEGVYIGLQGPTFETRAEYHWLHVIGGDAVGMSTVPEVIVANQLQLPCAAVSVITDECDPDNLHPVSIEEIIAVAGKADEKLSGIFASVIRKITG